MWFDNRKYSISHEQFNDLTNQATDVLEHAKAIDAEYWVRTGGAVPEDKLMLMAVLSFLNMKLEENK